MHKVVAQRYGLWAEFRYNPRGLVFAFIFAAAIGFLYGAQGANWISGAVTKEQNGRISAAGPVTNLVISAVPYARVLAHMPRPSSFGRPLRDRQRLEAAPMPACRTGPNHTPAKP